MQLTPEPIASLDAERRRALFQRDAGIEEIRDQVRDIIDRVREDGDAALREFSREYDDVTLGTIDVTDEVDQAAKRVDSEVRRAIEDAAANIRNFHEEQLRTDWRIEDDGRELGRRFRPIERVGVYAPGGTAAYPSSALMGIIPATVAGVEEVVVATPPAETMNPATLAAIDIAGADSVYSIGGAQAIAAMAYGTGTVEPVQQIVGPGNRWVTAAKAEVQGAVSIDFLAGPSEVLIIADETADPSLVALELLAQAEHDPNSSVVAVMDSRDTAEAVCAQTVAGIGKWDRSEVIEAALSHDASGVFLADSVQEAADFAEAYAAEHLVIQAAQDEAILDRIDSAGSVFLGEHTPVAAGDYATGTNHVLPTSAKAKIVGGLSVDTFLRASTVQRLDASALADLRETITTLARAEGLEAHAESVERRFEDG